LPAPVLHLDVEARSAVSIKTAGPTRYAEDPTTDVWCAAWAINDGPIAIWHPGEQVPDQLAEHVRAGGRICAHNIGFEWAIWRLILTPRYGWPEPTLEQLDCTAARAAAMALPRKLEDAAQALGLPVTKDMAGHRLMLQMARPRAVNGALVWWDEPDKLERLGAYCRQDVEVERALDRRTRSLSASERDLFLLDLKINKRGLSLDQTLIAAAQAVVDRTLAALNAELREVTGGIVTSTTKLADLKRWLNEQGLAHTVETLGQAAIAELLQGDLPPHARRALETRAKAAKTSTAKLRAFEARVCRDGRLRDNLIFHGANTGRWAGRGAQLQNLPRPTLVTDQDTAIKLILEQGEVDQLGPPLAIVSEILRGVLIAAEGHELLAADYVAIEARVLAWLACQLDLLQQFRDGVDPYRRMAGRIYRLSIEDADALPKDSRERWIGKGVILGAGYQMGAKRFRDECAKQGVMISSAEAERIINTYRAANTRIVALWYELERAALQAVAQPGLIVPAAGGRVRFRVRRESLWLQLPSGRLLAYPKPRLEKRETPRGETRTTVAYYGRSQKTQQWGWQHGYGGKWTENIVQATARDLMAAGMLRLERAGYPVLLTVHDEVVAEVPKRFGSLEEFERLLAEAPDWAVGCPIVASGWRGKRYRK
jgi:DNA polymerase